MRTSSLRRLFGFSSFTAVMGLVFTCQAQLPPDLFLQQVATGLTAPLAARHAGDGSGRLFIVEQEGAIRIKTGTEILPTPFLDITSLVNCCGERGLLGLAFHPDYANNGYFYVNYTNAQGDTVVARYQVSAGDPNVADPASASVVLTVDQDFSNHNGGNILFGPDGYLYIGMGDGGSFGDPCDRAQTLDPANLNNSGSCAPDGDFSGNPDSRALLGKMLRIDVDSPGVNTDGVCAEGANYGIPADNPFEANGDSRCSETWAWGLRNPWRWSFDRQTGDIFMGDVGQNAADEINFQPAASTGNEHYGWSCREGDLPYDNSRCLAGVTMTEPILVEPLTSGNCAIIGGYRYRGPVAALNGLYFYGDTCTGQIWYASESGGNWTRQEWLHGEPILQFSLGSFGEDENGEVYVVSLAGDVFRMTTDMIFADGLE